jgi:hypothetical protein
VRERDRERHRERHRERETQRERDTERERERERDMMHCAGHSYPILLQNPDQLVDIIVEAA